MRLIDAETFEKQIEKEITRLNTNARRYFYNTGVKDHITVTVANTFVITKNWLNMQPAIEAKPVVHAHWQKYDDSEFCYCSNCGEPAADDESVSWSGYCPICGAQMDEGVNEMGRWA